MRDNEYWLGIDVGSTTVKAVVVHPESKEILFTKYLRHNAKQAETVLHILEDIGQKFKGKIRCAVCGSGGGMISTYIDAFFIQEVVANAVAVKEFYPRSRVAIELGGQDAKIIFFHHDERTGNIMASDMRMNGSCAGGTGAFVDQIAELLNIKAEEFGQLALKGTTVYDISGRCGVFAKTDIQPLLNQGVPREDIALSAFHAIAKQTIGGLAQGAEINPPIIFEGGPLTFNTKLVDVFIERLGLKEGEAIIPTNPETIVASGAALSLGIMFDENKYFDIHDAIAKLKVYDETFEVKDTYNLEKFFASEEDRKSFYERHVSLDFKKREFQPGDTVRCYLGIDAGSTTSKFVLIDEAGEVFDKFYASNVGEPLTVIQKALIDLRDSYKKAGVNLKILGMGSTGYGEIYFAKAFKSDYHTVETVAHAEAAMKYAPDVSFILDIGGQDMKAISVKEGIVTSIVLNEACSAGCGSFLETYAKSLEIPVSEIAEMAFKSEKPSRLGSRCTVFMNSCIVSEQRNGKTRADIMAGLCRSIIDNVFTKVVRIPNFGMLGKVVIVQGGTFKNDAVLRTMEQFTGRTVIRPPHPGEMGAIGIALLTKKYIEEFKAKGIPYESKFIGLDAMDGFWHEKQAGNICQLCTNNCNRTVVKFPDGSTYITGNRCDRGEVLEETVVTGSSVAKPEIASKKKEHSQNLFDFRTKLLFRDYPYVQISPSKDMTIGIPRVLEFWHSMPFWKTFFLSLGFKVEVSSRSSQKMFQSGLHSIPSDTVCFPAKLVHGHIKNLAAKKVDRIFMPMLNRMPPENQSKTGSHNCAVLKGYPLVIHFSDEPEKQYGIPFDHPMFHWFREIDRDIQLKDWAAKTFGLPEHIIAQAITQSDAAQEMFKNELQAEGQRILDELASDTNPQHFGIVLAGRPYHGDNLINHDLASFFHKEGIPVLTLDSLPSLDSVDLSRTRAEITNPFHTRMYAGSILAAQNPKLEYVQIVSFGCGHDAILSDEIIYIMDKISGKTPLVLKLDESDVKGPLTIRVRSFVETIRSRRAKMGYTVKELPDPFAVKFTQYSKKEHTILVPNVTEAWSKMIGAAIASEGFKVATIPLADHNAMALGKQYIHNDMCYPCQVNVGEMIAVLRSGKYDVNKVTCGLAKAQCDCRLAHYASLARKALDEAGYPQVPIITTDKDTKDMHPAFKLGLRFQLRAMWGLNMVDILEHVQRRLRPYELVPGQTNEIFDESVLRISSALRTSSSKALKEFEAAIDKFAAMPADLRYRRPRVFIIGEFLLNFHPESNMRVGDYLEQNGMEAVFPETFTPLHRDFLRIDAEVRHFFVQYPMMEVLTNDITLRMIDAVKRKVNKIASRMPFFETPVPIRELASIGDEVVHHTFNPGEGWLIAAEILHNAEAGINSFIILQPFGCLPNHIIGRGLIKALKEKRPGIQILPLDFDPDTSFANIENRLQMLIMSAKEAEKSRLAELAEKAENTK